MAKLMSYGEYGPEGRERALERARTMLGVWQDGDGLTDSSALGDCVADLLHYAISRGTSPEEVVRMATFHAQAEAGDAYDDAATWAAQNPPEDGI